jgi:hypothetical protein
MHSMKWSERGRRVGLGGMVRTAWNPMGRRRSEVSNHRRSAWILDVVLADRTERRPVFGGWRRAHIGFVSFSVSVTVVCGQAPRFTGSP